MGKSQKIKLEHLDQTLIDWIQHALHSGVISFSDLNQDLQNAITNANHGTSSYNDTPVRNELTNLDNKKLSKEDARLEYHRKDTPLTIDDMNDNIKELLRSVKGVNTAFKRGLRLSDTPIEMNDLDGSIRNLIETNEQRLTRLEAVKKTINDAIVALTNTAGDASNSLISLGTTVSNLNSEINTLKRNLQNNIDITTANSSKIAALQEKTNTLKTKLDAVSNNNIELSDGKILSKYMPSNLPTKLDLLSLEDRINGIVNKANPINGIDGMMAFVTNSDINRTGELRGGNLFIAGVFANTLEELNNYKAKKMPVIISIFDDKIYVTTGFIRDNMISVTNTQGKIKSYGNYAVYSLIEITNELADGQIHSTNPDPNAAAEEDETNFFNFDYTSGGPLTTHWGLNQKFFLDIKTGYVLFNDNGAFINLITSDVNYKTLKASPVINTIVEATKAKANGIALFTSNLLSNSTVPNNDNNINVINNDTEFRNYFGDDINLKNILGKLILDATKETPILFSNIKTNIEIVKTSYLDKNNKIFTANNFITSIYNTEGINVYIGDYNPTTKETTNLTLVKNPTNGIFTHAFNENEVIDMYKIIVLKDLIGKKILEKIVHIKNKFTTTFNNVPEEFTETPIVYDEILTYNFDPFIIFDKVLIGQSHSRGPGIEYDDGSIPKQKFEGYYNNNKLTEQNSMIAKLTEFNYGVFLPNTKFMDTSSLSIGQNTKLIVAPKLEFFYIINIKNKAEYWGKQSIEVRIPETCQIYNESERYSPTINTSKINILNLNRTKKYNFSTQTWDTLPSTEPKVNFGGGIQTIPGEYSKTEHVWRIKQ